jgi:exodeoxyribonuclease V alpha subunit
VTQAREKWVDVFARDRADLGPAHVGVLAALEAANYAQPRPLNQRLEELRGAWDREARCLQRLERDQARRGDLREIVGLRRTLPAELAAVEERYHHARISTHRQRS